MAACYILTGHTPHDTSASLHEAIRRVAHDPPRSPRALDPTLPKALAFVLAKATSPQPAHRFASAAEFAEHLRQSIEAAGPSIFERVRFWIRRHPGQMVWGLTLAVAVAASMVLVAVAADYRARMEEHRQTVTRIEQGRKERRERQIERVRRAIELGEHFDATLVLLNVAEEIEADHLDDREALRRFTEVLGELFDAAAAERQAGDEAPGEPGAADPEDPGAAEQGEPGAADPREAGAAEPREAGIGDQGDAESPLASK